MIVPHPLILIDPIAPDRNLRVRCRPLISTLQKRRRLPNQERALLRGGSVPGATIEQ